VTWRALSISAYQLLHRDLVDLVDGVHALGVHAAALDDVDQLLVRAVLHVVPDVALESS